MGGVIIPVECMNVCFLCLVFLIIKHFGNNMEF